MIPKLEQKILVYGYTIAQIAILAAIAFAFLLVFRELTKSVGFISSLVWGMVIVGIPAVLFKTTNVTPARFIEGFYHYYFVKPDIYVPGKEMVGYE